MGTDEITQLDIWVAPFWEYIYLMLTSPDCKPRTETQFKLQAAVMAPKWCEYMEKWREHPAIKPYRFNEKANNNHEIRSADWEKGVKCQLSLDVLEGCFDEKNENL